jgi:DNA invertase Pin-like site-specific DNA recombinase
MIIGYKRVSTIEQNEARQLDGKELEKVFIDKCSGVAADRPALNEMLEFCREGDTILVHSLDRLARSVEHAKKIINQIIDKKVTVTFLEENLTFNKAENSPYAELIFHITAMFAQFERRIIKERQRQGIEIAKKKGLYKGRKCSITAEMKKIILFKLQCNVRKAQICKDLKISRSTLYKFLTDNFEKSVSFSDKPKIIKTDEKKVNE